MSANDREKPTLPLIFGIVSHPKDDEPILVGTVLDGEKASYMAQHIPNAVALPFININDVIDLIRSGRTREEVISLIKAFCH